VKPRTQKALVRRAAEAEEDMGTARLVARARKELAGGPPLLPKAFADRIADGEHPIRVLRGWREMTQSQLSAETGLAQGYISDLENGRRNGTTDALKHIAGALKVPLEMLT
jgi:hypothetical protein